MNWKEFAVLYIGGAIAYAVLWFETVWRRK